MASRIVTRGLLRIGQQTSQSTNYSVSRFIRTLSVDDSAVAFAAGDTALNTGGAVTNMFDKALDSTPTEAAPAVISHVCTLLTTDYNQNIKRIALHDDTAATVTTSTATLIGGVDAQSLLKTTDFSLVITMKITYTNV